MLPKFLVTIVDVKWHGSTVVELPCNDPGGLGNNLLYRGRGPAIKIASVGRPWSFGGGAAFQRLKPLDLSF